MTRFQAVLLIATAPLLRASSTSAWEMNTFQDFMKGRFSGVSLSRDGKLSIAPRMDQIFDSAEPYLWSVASDAAGNLYVGTGHRGRVYRITSNGKRELLWTAPEPEIFALTAGPDGSVYAGTSPDGKIYRIQNGKASEYFSPKARYIWALLFGKDGALYAGTGDGGKVFRIAAAGSGEVYYDTGQSNVTCLAVDVNGQLLAGTDPNGMLYRISARDKAFVLYDANLPEVRTVTLGTDGSVYAAALGGSVAQRTAAAATGTSSTISSGPVSAPVTTITVTDEAQAGLELKPKPAVDPAKPAQPAAAPVYTAPVETAGVEKSAIYRILPDNTVETLWSSKEENVYDLLLNGSSLLFATDQHGHLYRMSADRKVTLLAQAEGETVRLATSGDAVLAATGTQGKLYRLMDAAGATGVYESPVHDAGTVARWGQLTWRGEKTSGAKLSFRTRSGNSARPDRTWSEWSAPVSDPNGSTMASPNARFAQWKAELVGTGSASPTVTGVTLSYLPQNTAPVIKSLNVITQLVPLTAGAKPAAQAQPASATYSITVTDTGEAGASTLSGTPTQSVSRGMSQQIQVNWQADDTDGDKLAYTLWFRGEEESAWKLLRGNMTESLITFEGDVFADGKYLFRLVASDRPSNPGLAAREAELISAPVQFDNTPPVLRVTASRRNGSSIEVDVVAHDAASTLRRAEYSVDATGWLPLEAEDGIVDGKDERFALRIANASPGEHLIVIRAYDSANNAGLTKVVVP